jgi:hypothetical protein
MDLTNLTPEQKAELMNQLAAEQKEIEAKKEGDRKVLKELSNTATSEMVVELIRMSKMLSDMKKLVFDNFDHLIEMKKSVYNVKADQQSHTFSNEEQTMRITLGYRVTDNYDDTASVGIEKIRTYIQSLATDEATGNLVDVVNNLLRKDNKGNLKASRVLELQKMTNKITDADFVDGVKILAESYKPNKSCNFVEAQVKDIQGNWQSVPLSISSAEFPL